MAVDESEGSIQRWRAIARNWPKLWPADSRRAARHLCIGYRLGILVGEVEGLFNGKSGPGAKVWRGAFVISGSENMPGRTVDQLVEVVVQLVRDRVRPAIAAAERTPGGNVWDYSALENGTRNALAGIDELAGRAVRAAVQGPPV